MAFNGNGVFNRLYNWVQDAASGINIRADRMDQEMDGFATGLSTCLTKDGQSSMEANLRMGGFAITGLKDPQSDQDAATKKYADGRLPVIGGTMTGLLTLNPNLLAPLVIRGRSSDQFSQIEWRTNDGVATNSWAIRGVPTALGSMQWLHNGQPRMTLHADGSPQFGKLEVLGPVSVIASDANRASLNIPHGAAPTTPVDGDIWSTTAGVFARINGQNVNLATQPTPIDFATTAEAIAGVNTTKVMSPALVQARQGIQTLSSPGTQLTFDQVPAEANEIDLLMVNLGYAANATITLDFAGATSPQFNWIRHVMGNAYAAPVGNAADSAAQIDTDTQARSITGMIRMVRDAGPGGSWRAMGSYRRTSTNYVAFQGVFFVNGGLPRLNCFQSGGFTGGSATIRWRI